MSNPGNALIIECYTGKEPYIFASYSHKDKTVVYPELKALEYMGYRIWYDEGIDPGDEWSDTIAEAIDKCIHFIVFISPNSVASKHVKDEIQYALDTNKPFLAVYICKTVLPGGVKLSIGRLHAIMKFEMDDEIYLKKIRKSLPENVIKLDKTNNELIKLQASAESGDLNAQLNLAAKYYNGDGVEVNKTEAAKWYRKAAEQGDENAKRNLARLLK